ncbi:MAG: ribosome maturation factor RimM, partial [Cellulosilyticaceae bacterium]
YHKDFVLLRFKGVETMNDAELLKNSIIKIDRKDSLPLNENEYYMSDLYNMEVVTEEGRNLGTVRDILVTGANDVYVVNDGQKEILIPAIKQCIKEVDLNNRKITVHLLKGLE